MTPVGCEECLFVRCATKGRMRRCNPCAGNLPIPADKPVIKQSQRTHNMRAGTANNKMSKANRKVVESNDGRSS